MAALRAQPQHRFARESTHDVWPEHWGITISQCMQFLQDCRRDPAWKTTNTVYDLVQQYVKPTTLGTGVGLALMMNYDRPREVNVLISHAWGENAEEFFRTLERSVADDDVMFICALSLYQGEDGNGPSVAEQLGSGELESPFRRVLEHIRCKGEAKGMLWKYHQFLMMLPLLCLQMSFLLYFIPVANLGCIPTWSYCGVQDSHSLWIGASRVDFNPFPVFTSENVKYTYVELPFAYSLFLPCAISFVLLGACLRLTMPKWGMYRGRVLAVPNSQCDLFSRLWCVYEIFVASTSGIPIELAHTLTSAGRASSHLAISSSEADRVRIQKEIAAWSIHHDPKYSQNSMGYAFDHLLSLHLHNGYNRIDRAIKETTSSAQRKMYLVSAAWAFPYAVAQAGFLDGKSFVEDTWEFGAVIGFATFIFVTFSIAKRCQGVLTFTCAIGVIIAFVLIGILGQCIVVHYLRGGALLTPSTHLHLFIMCLCQTYFHAGVSLAIILALTLQCPVNMALRFRPYQMHCLIVVSAIGIGFKSFFTMSQMKGISASDAYPFIVAFVSRQCIPYLGLPIFMWGAAVQWGVRLEHQSLFGDSIESTSECNSDCSSYGSSEDGEP